MEGQDSSDVAVNSKEMGCTENEPAVNQLEGEKHSMVNGLSNGYDKVKKDKERHKDKHHEKDRDKDRHKDRDGDKHRSRDEKDKHREKHKSEHKDKDRDKEKHRDKDKKEREKSKHSSSSSSKDKHSSSSSSKDKDKDRDKDKERRDKERKERDKDKEKEHKSSSSSSKDKSEHKSSSTSKHSSSSSSKPSSGSSSKDKEHRDKDKERDKEKDKHRDKDKDKERSREKHSSSSSKDKDRHSSDKHKSDKDRHSSSSKDKDKDRHSSDKKDKDKHRDKDKDRDGSKEMNKSKEKEIKQESPQVKQELYEIKEEVKEGYEDYSFQNNVKEESLDDDDGGKLMIKEEPTDDEESRLDTTVKTEPKTEEEDDDDDLPMAARMQKIKNERHLDSEDEEFQAAPMQKIKNKRHLDSEDEDDVPLSARKKPKKESAKKRKRVDNDYEDEEEDFKPAKKAKIKKEVKKEKRGDKSQGSFTESPKKKKKEDEQEVWKWWEEEKKPDGVKWTFLEHKGPVFAPLYERLPHKVKFYYDGEEFELSEKAEEVATFYARMLEHDYTTMDAFNKNFMNDWRSVMTSKERDRIKDLSKCDFKRIHAYFIQKTEERKAMSKEEKKKIKEDNEKLISEYGFCMIDGHKEKIGNFKIEPPGLFRGRGMHPKMGKLKKRVMAEEIIINCSKDSKVPKPPEGHRWKEVRHDNAVTWLASWNENVQGQVKYIMLNPSSKLKGEKDWQKYEMARKLAKSIDKIRDDYIADFKSKEMRIRQRAVAMYFIDKLALRAGNEKDEDQADTVGCCSLRVEHIALHPTKDGKECVVVFDFLGKDSIRYYNEVPVEKRVFKNLTLFMENKKGEDDLFDRLNTQVLNKHLSDLMEGLTAKVFRTYNASITLQNQLKELTDEDTSIAEKLLSYNRANRAVAVLCNHQRAVPKTHDKSMASLREKLEKKRETVDEAERAYKNAKRDAKHGSAKERIGADKAKKTLERLREQLLKLEVQETDKEENKTIALGTSKLNYLDPRISVAWCKKHDVPIEKVYNKTQRDKFRWAIDMATADYIF